MAKKEAVTDDGLVEMIKDEETLRSHPMHVDAWVALGWTVVE